MLSADVEYNIITGMSDLAINVQNIFLVVGCKLFGTKGIQKGTGNVTKRLHRCR